MHYEVKEIITGAFAVVHTDEVTEPQAVVFGAGQVLFDTYNAALLAAIKTNLNPLKLS
jgi:hypothetical protein